MTTLDTAPSPTPATTTTHRLGLAQATALVVGSIIGVGIFGLPYALATFGPISLLAMALTSVGAVALALLFAALSRRMPADGGPYAYARTAFGNAVGFANAWSYWITAWAGNAAIAVGWVFYVEKFVNPNGQWGWSMGIALVGLWLPAAVNLTGLRSVGAVQLWTTVLKFVPLVLMATVGLFFISTENFTPWNTSGETSLAAVGGAMAICLFSYLGVETAAVAAAKVRNRRRNVPRATVLGTVASAVVYLLSMVAVFGILPADTLAADANQASYAAATDAVVGGTWAGYLVAAAVVVSGLGALNGWTMICAEMPRAAARDGLFPGQFATVSRREAPAFGIISSTLLASVAVVVSYLGTSGATVFITLVLMSGITAAIPYGFSALAQIVWRVRDHGRPSAATVVRDVVVAGLALVFSIAFIYYSRNSSDVWYVTWGPFLMAGAAFALGVPIYLSRRRHMTKPADVPAVPER
jgi:APA family basic amino acid/polyamine antiporter